MSAFSAPLSGLDRDGLRKTGTYSPDAVGYVRLVVAPRTPSPHDRQPFEHMEDRAECQVRRHKD